MPSWVGPQILALGLAGQSFLHSALLKDEWSDFDKFWQKRDQRRVCCSAILHWLHTFLQRLPERQVQKWTLKTTGREKKATDWPKKKCWTSTVCLCDQKMKRNSVYVYACVSSFLFLPSNDSLDMRRTDRLLHTPDHSVQHTLPAVTKTKTRLKINFGSFFRKVLFPFLQVEFKSFKSAFLRR